MTNDDIRVRELVDPLEGRDPYDAAFVVGDSLHGNVLVIYATGAGKKFASDAHARRVAEPYLHEPQRPTLIVDADEQVVREDGPSGF